MITPMKWFWHTLTWMQVSPIATTIDLFGERKTVVPLLSSTPTILALNPTSTEHHSETNTEAAPNALLSSIDQTFAQWEKAFPNPPLKKIVHSTWWEEASFQLFNTPKPPTVNFQEQSPEPQLSGNSPSPFEHLLQPSPPPPSSALTKAQPRSITRKVFRRLNLTPNFSNQGAIEAQQQWQKITMNPRPLDWTVNWDEIEVEFTDLGYHQHPLEIVLTQVDILLVKIETWFHSLWQWWHDRNRE
jgi:hypothetical protein